MAQKPEEKMDEVKGEVYEPAPRGAARVAGVDLAAIDARLKECAEFFTKHCDEADYRNLDWYQWRMQLRLWRRVVCMSAMRCIWSSSRPKCL